MVVVGFAAVDEEQEEREASLLADELDAAFQDDDDAVAEVAKASDNYTAALRDIATTVGDNLSSTSSDETPRHQHHHHHQQLKLRKRKRQYAGDEQRRHRPAVASVEQHETKEHVAENVAGDLSALPPELISRVLRFVGPQGAHAFPCTQDLATIALACRMLRQLAEDQALWRRLFCQRWGVPSMAAAQKTSPSRVPLSWKQMYFDKDAAEMAHAVYDVSPDIRQFFQQMQAAKRAQAPAFKQVQADDMVVLDTSIADQITTWRRRHGLDGATHHLASYDHVCSGSSCSYHQIGDVFLCERTGRAHVCDDTCRERVVDSSNGLLVCSISGRCFDRWLTEDEEVGQPQADANEGADADDFESYNVGGRLAAAYLVGWGCRNERELKRALER